MADLVIKISGDSKDFKGSLQEVKDEAKGMDDTLSKIAKISAAAFAALAVEIGLAAKAYAEGEAASRKLTQALQNQGIFTGDLIDSYKAYASEIQKATGIDDDSIVTAQAKMQAMIGQTKITKEMTWAMADLSTETGSVESAAEIMARAINGNTRGLKQFNITIDENLTKQERTAAIMAAVNQRYGDQAKAQAEGLGSTRKLKAAFDDFQKILGEAVAPAITRVVVGMTELITRINEMFGITKATQNLRDHREAIQNIREEIKKLESDTSGGAVELFQDDGSRTGAGAARALAEFKKTREGRLNELKASLASEEKLQEEFEKSKVKKAAAIRAEAKGNEEASRKLASAQAENELILMAHQNASKARVDLQKEEVEILKKLEDEKYAGVQEQLTARREELIGLKDEQFNEDLEKEGEYNAITLENQAGFEQMSAEQKALFREQHQAALLAQIQTEDSTKRQALANQMAVEIQAHNLFLAEKERYGVAVAAIDQVINTKQVQGFKSATAELAQMTQSRNSTLKTIGKAAAITQITINTAEGSMRIMKGMIEAMGPIFGTIVGAAMVGAYVAFGAEQIGNVAAAAQGGLISGGVPGRDSVPAMLMPGELVVPTRNYEEVVSAVSSRRTGGDAGTVGQGYAEIILTMKDDLMDFIEAKLVERQRLGISIQGA